MAHIQKATESYNYVNILHYLPELNHIRPYDQKHAYRLGNPTLRN